jgi:hypothetical protein
MTNDFINCLTDEINVIQDLPLKAKIGFIGFHESLRVYPLSGGKEVTRWMNGDCEMKLPYAIGIKTKNQTVASDTMWKIHAWLSDFDISIPSNNDSYEFEGLEVSTPSLREVEKDGWYIYLLDVTANLIIKKTEES